MARYLTNQEIKELLHTFEHEPAERHFKFFFMIKGLRDDFIANTFQLAAFDLVKIVLLGLLLWRVW